MTRFLTQSQSARSISMSREIKFRAWDKAQKKMIDSSWSDVSISAWMDSWKWGITLHSCGGEFMDRFEDVILLQYTGLKDKNGKEIYQSDIVAINEGICLVVWIDKFASWAIDRQGWAYLHFFGEAVDPLRCEVIGNIYENPDLLKARTE